MLDKFITMDHGSGGIKTSELIEEMFLKAFANPELNALKDGAILKSKGKLAFSTDSFVISPLFYPGGDIGHLCVCGTANDLAMCGAKPKWLSLSFILEEGFPIESLQRIIDSISKTAKEAGIMIVTGDTKVVEHGKCDGIYINTAGIGEIEYDQLSLDLIKPGDKIIVSGSVGDHGTAIMMARNELGLMGNLESDNQVLYPLAHAAWETGGVRMMRDATRGGIATTLNEFAENRNFGIELIEKDIPVKPEVNAVCEMLGLDPLYCANEGKMVLIAQADKAEEIIEHLHKIHGGEDAAIIGMVTQNHPGKLVLRNKLGTGRILLKLAGAQLPRIC